MLFISHVIAKQKLPSGKDWQNLAIYGLLNIAVYLGFFIIGMQFVSAAIASLFIATNPVFISIISAIWLKKPIRAITIISLLICTAGILVAAWPLFRSSFVTPLGLVIILVSMLSYSLASVFFAKQAWHGLHILTINGWQTFFGALFTLPFFLLFYKPDLNSINLEFTTSVLWLALPVSIGAVQLWMFLLKENPVKASFWLFLCPISGILIAAAILKEPISLYTAAGVALVLAGLYIIQRKKLQEIKTTTAAIAEV